MSWDYFYSRYIAPPDVTPQNCCFSPEHLILTTLIVIGIIALVRTVHHRKDIAFNRRVVMILAIAMLCLESCRYIWRIAYYGITPDNVRYDWCNQICIALPIIALFRWEKAYPFIDSAALLGGVTVLIYPLWVFYDYAGIHVMAVQSMLSHGLMVTVALLLPTTTTTYDRSTNLSSSLMWKRIGGLDILLLIAFIASNVKGVNYLIMLSADGIPVLQHIPFPYYWILALPGFILGIYLASVALALFDCWMMDKRPAFRWLRSRKNDDKLAKATRM